MTPEEKVEIVIAQLEQIQKEIVCLLALIAQGKYPLAAQGLRILRRQTEITLGKVK